MTKDLRALLCESPEAVELRRLYREAHGTLNGLDAFRAKFPNESQAIEILKIIISTK